MGKRGQILGLHSPNEHGFAGLQGKRQVQCQSCARGNIERRGRDSKQRCRKRGNIWHVANPQCRAANLGCLQVIKGVSRIEARRQKRDGARRRRAGNLFVKNGSRLHGADKGTAEDFLKLPPRALKYRADSLCICPSPSGELAFRVGLRRVRLSVSCENELHKPAKSFQPPGKAGKQS